MQGEFTLVDHLKSQNENRETYIANLLLMIYKYKIKFTLQKRAHILAAALIRNDKDLYAFLFEEYRQDVPLMFRTCQILDSRRYSKQLQRKMLCLKSKKKIDKIKSQIANLQSLGEDVEMSLSKSKIEIFKREWIAKIPSDILAKMALRYPRETWQNILNLLHVNEKEFSVPWFNNYVWKKCGIGGDENTKMDIDVTFVYKYRPSFGFVKSQMKDIPSDVINALADHEDMDIIFHNWDVFSPFSEKIVTRLKTKGTDMLYGDMMRHLQTLPKDSPIFSELCRLAQDRLQGYSRISIDKPVAVLGDASCSMDVAIRTSSVITTILCSLFDAQLHFFRSKDENIENPPRTVLEALELGEKVIARDCTSPAASLEYYYQKGEIIKTFIIVTDEEENTDSPNLHLRFAPLFQKYYQEIYPAKLVFLSFLDRPTDKGRMVPELEQLKVQVQQFKFDSSKPDLRKLDAVLNQLTMQTESFKKELDEFKGKSLSEIRQTFIPSGPCNPPLHSVPLSKCLVQ